MLKSDEHVFRSVYDAHQRQVYAFAFYLTKSKDIAEEVVQEVFIRLWEKREQLNPDTQLLAYLKKITQNLVFDLFRKANRNHMLQEHLYQAMVEGERAQPDKLLEKELNCLYLQALEQLPPQQRIIFTLSRNENLTYQQIADYLHLSRNTVRNHMAEAIRSVRLYIERNTGITGLWVAILWRHLHK